MMTDHKKEEMYDNYMNGNKNNFKRQLRGLSKLDLLEFTEYFVQHNNTISTLKRYLQQ